MANKDLSKCVGKCKIHVDNVDKSWRVYLWKTFKDMEDQSVNDVSGARAYHKAFAYFLRSDENGDMIRSRTSPVMGELHFVSDNWNIEVVSHECCHAMFLCLASHGKYYCNADMEEEEKYCYLLGDLTRKVYLWLYEVDVVTKD